MLIQEVKYVGRPFPDVPEMVGRSPEDFFIYDMELHGLKQVDPIISFTETETEGIGLLYIGPSSIPTDSPFHLTGIEVYVIDENTGNEYIFKSPIDDPWGPILDDYHNFLIPINNLPVNWTTSEWSDEFETRIVQPSNFPISAWSSPVREVDSFVEEYDEEGNLLRTFHASDYLQNWTLQANSESGFIGKLSSYSLELNLLKMDDDLVQPQVGHYIKVYVGLKYRRNRVAYYIPYPRMWIFESAEVDGKQYHLQCYDDLVLIRWGSKTFNDFPHDLDLRSELDAMFALYNIQTVKDGYFITNDDAWGANSTVEQRMNYDPDTPIIKIIEDWMEINGCNGFMGWDDKFHIKQMNTPSTLSNNMVNSISIGQSFHVSGVAAVTTLGENIIYGDETETVIPLVDNGLITNHPNIDAIMYYLENDDDWVGFEWYDLHNVEVVTRGHINLTPFHLCSYDGNYFMHSNYTVVYDGGLRENMRWEYPEVEKYDFNVPGLDNVLQATTARVDKVNQTIELNVQRTDDLSEQISNLLVNLDGITSTVERLDKREVNNQDVTDAEIAALKRWTELAQTAEQVQILINEALQGGVTEVTTTTGFKFNKDGLNITKTGSDISTIVDNDGLRVLEQGETVMLKADHSGVDARNLTAHNYLQVAHSRFQHYGDCRTGLYYWIGDHN